MVRASFGAKVLSLLWAPGRADAAGPSLGAVVGFALGPVRSRTLARKEARKDGPSLLRSLISGADPLVVVEVVVVLAVCCVGSCCIEIVSSSRCSSYNDLLDVFSKRIDWMYLWWWCYLVIVDFVCIDNGNVDCGGIGWFRSCCHSIPISFNSIINIYNNYYIITTTINTTTITLFYNYHFPVTLATQSSTTLFI